ncbi:MAG TPA: hypothetical protein PLX18_11410 [Anaerohalosphaeraceae bacterium]|nr:hypothetical protein [Anaerohalosphaeraceae bacterium]HQG06858.1 hypothetical protein [Anaerohalosphaeraceae bacterium]HQI08449.1 hypothetical protein [Anaerohalosphaeraceae bacterium]HQJ68768.1 hypothetical protein [Anaerohalosphaeraceae bacterium]
MKTPLNLQTCDILLCSGSSRLSRRIKTYNRLLGIKGAAAEITHVALVAAQGAAVFESTTLNTWSGKKGTQVNLFDRWLDHYPGSVWVRRLNFTRSETFEADCVQEMSALVGKPYEHGIPGVLELLLCGIEWRWFRRLFDTQNRLRTAELHCTEAAAKVLQRMGLLRRLDNTGSWVCPNKLPPYQWWPGQRVETLLAQAARISEPEPLKI